VEDHASLLVLRVVRRARLLVTAKRVVDAWRKLTAEPVRLGDEVGERGGRVAEDHRPQARRLRERVLLGEEAAPRRAEDVVAVVDTEVVEQVRELSDKELDRPEVAVAIAQMR